MNVEPSNEHHKPALTQPFGRTMARHIQLAEAYLSARGITLDGFEAAKCEIVADASCIVSWYPAAPALVFWFFHPITGAPLTYTDERGVERRFHRIKPLGTHGAKFLNDRDAGTHVFYAQHANVDWPTVLSDVSYGLILTEGETRSLAGASCDLAVVSITGVDCGQVGGKLHPDLAVAELQGRQVFLTFDSDVTRKPRAQTALRKQATLLRERGAEVFVVSLPPAPDGSKQGLDDYLARYGVEAFKALLQSPETRPAEGAEVYEPPVALASIMATNYPPTEWIWQNLILKSAVNLLFGDGGTGKSLLALYLGIAVAAGKPLFGDATMQMPVVAFFAEDPAGQVQQRAANALRELGLDPAGDLPMKLWCQPRGDTLLATINDNGEVTELPRLHALRSELAELGGPALLIVDSLADLFALNESLRLPVNAALKQVLGGLCRDYGATVIVLAHPSKTSMKDGTHYSGSTAFNNSVRQRLTLEIVEYEPGSFAEGPPPRRLSAAKHNYGPPAEKTLWYYGTTIALLPSGTAADSGKAAAALRAVVVAAAKEAAKNNVPLNRREDSRRGFQGCGKGARIPAIAASERCAG